MNQLSPKQKKVSDYSILALAGLLIISVILFRDGNGLLAFLPLILGLIGLIFKGTLSPSFILLLAALLLLFQGKLRGGPTRSAGQFDGLTNFIMAFSCLIYCASHFRDLFLQSSSDKRISRWKKENFLPDLSRHWIMENATLKRNIPVSTRNILSLSISAFLLSMGAFILLNIFRIELPPDWFELPLPLWRLFLIFWTFTLVFLFIQIFKTFLGYLQATQEEALLYLQDVMWQSLRSEQRMIFRFIQRKKAKNKETK